MRRVIFLFNIVFIFQMIISSAFAGIKIKYLFEDSKFLKLQLKDLVKDFPVIVKEKSKVKSADQQIFKNLKEKLKNNTCGVFVKGDTSLALHCGKITAEVEFLPGEKFFKLNGKSINYINVANKRFFRMELEELLTAKTSFNPINLFIESAHADFGLTALLAVSIAVVIDTVVSMISQNLCEERFKATQKQVALSYSNCKRDLNAVASGSTVKKSTETYVYLQNIEQRITELEVGEDKISCVESVKDNFQAFTTWHMLSCIKSDALAKLLCKELEATKLCLMAFKKVKSKDLDTSSQEKEKLENLNLKEENLDITVQ
jgi:hypothetical protein